jgi:microcystin-dependent protein
LNTATTAAGNLEKISKKSFLSDVYPYILLPGMINLYGASTAPSGFLLCDGTAYPQTSYPDLFAIIGTTYGSAAPGTFRVPNMTPVSATPGTVNYIIKT